MRTIDDLSHAELVAEVKTFTKLWGDWARRPEAMGPSGVVGAAQFHDSVRAVAAQCAPGTVAAHVRCFELMRNCLLRNGFGAAVAELDALTSAYGGQAVAEADGNLRPKAGGGES